MVTAYSVDAGYRVDFFKNQIILGISIVQVVCMYTMFTIKLHTGTNASQI